MDATSTPPLLDEERRLELDWIPWLTGWFFLIYELLTQKIASRNLPNPLPLPKLNDCTCIVSGSTSGIGLEMARQLAISGARVVMAVRNKARAHDLIQIWKKEWLGLGPFNVEVMELNLLSLGSVVRFAKAWNARSEPLNILINNAGIFSIGEPQKFSQDGYESHLQVNHLAPALLSLLLLPSLTKGSPSRIINVNSAMHYIGFVGVDDMSFLSGKRKFSSQKGYSSSKLAQVMFSGILQESLPVEAGVSVVCVNPGTVKTNVVRDLPNIVQAAYHCIPFFLFDSLEGSRSTLFAATDPIMLDHYKDLQMKKYPICAFISTNCCLTNPCSEARNIRTARVVWEKTLDMIGLPPDPVDMLLHGEEVQCRYELSESKFAVWFHSK